MSLIVVKPKKLDSNRKKKTSLESGLGESLTSKELSKEIQKTTKYGTIHEIELDKIKSPVFHDRNFISKAKIKDLANDIEKVGLTHPILVREKGSYYERIVGYRRVKAVELLYEENRIKEKKIKCIIINANDALARAITISENAEREDPNEYDRVVSHIEYIGYELDLEFEEAKSFVRRYGNFLKGRIKNITDEEKLLFQKLQDIVAYLKYNKFSTLLKKIEILSICDKVKELVVEIDLGFSAAIALNKVRENLWFNDLIEEVKKEKMGGTLIEKRIEELLKIKKLLQLKIG
jgi:ParB family chromosome partitioning protein